MFLSKQTFLIVGMSRSGFYACSALLKRGAKCFVYDDSPRAEALKNIKNAEIGGAIHLDKSALFEKLKNIDVAVISPGVPIDGEIPVACKNAGLNVIGEIELGGLISLNPIIAVTGTNGKTTVCALVDYILSLESVPHYLAGNYGVPFTAFEKEFNNEKEIALLEVSSFQFETAAKFTPHISCVLNIGPDHLDRHYNMANYTFLKSRAVLNQRESEYAVLNRDDETVKEFAKKTRAKIVYFSLEKQQNGAYVEDGYIRFGNEKVCETELLALKGKHNLQNALAATAICRLVGVSAKTIRNGLCSFKGVKHRLQTVDEIGGVIYINDSKSTNAGAAITALADMSRPFVWLAGGKDKGEGYDELFASAAKNPLLKQTVIYGESAKKLYASAAGAGIKGAFVFPDFLHACDYAFSLAEKGDCVLLSPACASFDEFSGFEQRGDAFISLVNEKKKAFSGKCGVCVAEKNKFYAAGDDRFSAKSEICSAAENHNSATEELYATGYEKADSSVCATSDCLRKDRCKCENNSCSGDCVFAEEECE